jgi:hypothetical protein
MQIRLTAPGATDKFTYFGSSTATNLVLGVGGEKLRITGAGNVGIGTSSPAQKLTVAGTIQSTSGGFKFPDGSVLSSAVTQSNITTSLTYVGSTTTQIVKATQNSSAASGDFAAGVPAGLRGDSTVTDSTYAAGVFGLASGIRSAGVAGVNTSNCAANDTGDTPQCNSYGVYGLSANAARGVGVWGEALNTTFDNVGVYGKARGVQGTGVFGFTDNTSGTSDATGVAGLTAAPYGAGVQGNATSTAVCSGTCVSSSGVYGSVASVTGASGLFDAPTNSNLLVGRVVTGTVPTQTATRVFHVTSSGDFYAKSFNPGGADFAEAVDAIGGSAQYEPGDVMMIDETGSRRLALANEAYSTKVAGIYSTKPGVLASPHAIDDPRISKEVPLAIVGIVPCKVSAENGPIHAGDMLVTASKPGYAMKGTDRTKMLGAVVGKALGSLDEGTGTVEVLVSLH